MPDLIARQVERALGRVLGRVGEQVLIEAQGELARIPVTDAVAHGDDLGHATAHQGEGGAGVA